MRLHFATPKWIAFQTSRLPTLALLLVVSFCQVGFAQSDLASRQMEILQTVLSVEGYITQDLHREFWSDAPQAMLEDDKAREAFMRQIDRAIVPGVRFQRETWASMMESIRAGKVTKTPGYEEAKSAAIATMPPTTASRQAIQNAEAMLLAAATRKPFRSARGVMYITPEVVTQVLSGLDGAIARVRQLANPTWAPSSDEHRFPRAHVAILSSTPFTEETQDISLANGRSTQTVSLTSRLNATDYVIVSFSNYGGNWADPKGAVIRTAQSALKGMGATSPRTASSLWRNRLSASGLETIHTSEGAIHTSIRVVEVREHTGALTFIAITEKSKVEANSLRESLERSTQLLD